MLPAAAYDALPAATWRLLATLPLRATHPLDFYRGTRHPPVQLAIAVAAFERPFDLPGYLRHRAVRDRGPAQRRPFRASYLSRAPAMAKTSCHVLARRERRFVPGSWGLTTRRSCPGSPERARIPVPDQLRFHPLVDNPSRVCKDAQDSSRVPSKDRLRPNELFVELVFRKRLAGAMCVRVVSDLEPWACSRPTAFQSRQRALGADIRRPSIGVDEDDRRGAEVAENGCGVGLEACVTVVERKEREFGSRSFPHLRPCVAGIRLRRET